MRVTSGERQHGLKPIIRFVILRSGYFVQPLRGCKSFVDFTTGFGLRPPPAAIIVMTPSGSGKEKLRERLQKKNPLILHHGLVKNPRLTARAI